MPANTTSRSGFSLVELVIAIVVAGILGTGVAHLFMVQNQMYIRQNTGVLAGQNARAGFDMVIREMRNAGFDPRGTSGAGILVWTADTFHWTADLNADGDVLDSGENTRYYHDADDEALVRRVGITDTPVADGITALEFTYFQDRDGTPATSSGEIRRVRVELSFETPDGVLPGELKTEVAVRNNIY